MNFKNSKSPSLEEMAKIEKQRTLSDAELLKGGAEYKFNEKGEKRLEVTEKQINGTRNEMKKDKNKETTIESIHETARNEYLRIFNELKQAGNSLTKESLDDPEFYKKVNFRDNKILGDAINELSKITGYFNPVFFEKIEREALEEVRRGKQIGTKSQINLNANSQEKSLKGIKSDNNNEQDKKENQDPILLLSKDCGFEIEGMAIGVPRTFMFRGKEWRINSYDSKTKQLSIEIPLEHKTSMTLEEFKKINQPKLFKNHRSELELRMFKDLRDKADNWEKLYRLIEDSGGIQGINGFFEPDRLINIIKQAREKRLDVSRIPNTLGLRDKIIELIKIEEVRKKINPENPESPSDLSPLSEKDFNNLGISKEDLGKPYSFSRSETLSSMYGEYPEIGVNGLRTERGMINGKLVWCNGEIAIFETPEGKIKVPFRKLISPSGETYEQIERKRKDKERRRKFVTKPKERAL